MPPSAPALDVQADTHELRLVLGERTYRVRGLDKNLSYESLKVTLRVTAGDRFHVDTLDLCAAKQRQGWTRQASIELGALRGHPESGSGQAAASL